MVIQALIEKWLHGGKKPFPATPLQMYGEVFEAVQMARVFPDTMTFVQCIPKMPPQEIQKAYHAKKADASFDIRAFVEEHWTIPPATSAPIPKGARWDDIRAYIEAAWDTLTLEATAPEEHSTLLALPHPYIAPGGRFRELYYWDSYFTALGLRESKRFTLIRNITDNFAYLIDTYGHIPNGTRSYFLSRSQPPFFPLIVSLLAEIEGQDALIRYLPAMEKEYAFWMRGQHDAAFRDGLANAAEHVVRMPGGEILNRYFDPRNEPREELYAEDVATAADAPDPRVVYRHIRAGTESGWDFSSRWFADGLTMETIRTGDIAPVDLNALMVAMEETIARAHDLAGNADQAKAFRERAAIRAEAIRKLMWSEELGWFNDALFASGEHTATPSLAGMFPLFAGIASAEQALRAKGTLEARFLREGGLLTTEVHSGEQWDAPNGWAPLQYVAVMGLERYGLRESAEQIARRWCKTVSEAYEGTHALHEKYNVEHPRELAGGGEYELQFGFGWTNGVLLAFMNHYGISSLREATAPTPDLAVEHAADDLAAPAEPAHTQ